jgi:hypothetical protein
MDQGGQGCDQVDPAVMLIFRQTVRLQLHALAYNLADFMRSLAIRRRQSSGR